MKWIVYETVNIVNNKIYVGVHKTENPEVFDGYIGCGVTVTSPYSYNKKQTPFHCAVAKYGPGKFKRTTLRVFDNKTDAFNLEKEIVTPDFIKRSDVYNACLGGYGGCSIYMPVYQFNLDGSLIKEWDSMQDVADFYYTSHTSVMHAIKNKSCYQNCFWSHDKTIDIEEFFIYKGGTIVHKYDGETGKYIESYSSMPLAAKDNNVLIQQIQNAVKGGYIASGFYYSKDLYEFYTGKNKISIKNKTLYVYNLNGDFVTELNGSAEICKFLNAKFINSVTNAMRMNRPYRGYQLSLEKLDKMNPNIDKRNIKKPILQYSLIGEFIKEFSSISEAEMIYGSGVRRVLKGQQKHCHNFIFKYKS